MIRFEKFLTKVQLTTDGMNCEKQRKTSEIGFYRWFLIWPIFNVENINKSENLEFLVIRLKKKPLCSQRSKGVQKESRCNAYLIMIIISLSSIDLRGGGGYSMIISRLDKVLNGAKKVQKNLIMPEFAFNRIAGSCNSHY